MNPRAIAVQGVGFGALLTAVQGLIGLAPTSSGRGGGLRFYAQPMPPTDHRKRLREDDSLLLLLM